MQVLSRSALKQMIDEQQDFMLLNVLSTSSFRKAHIPDSQHVSVAEPDFVRQVESLLGGKAKDYPIVTYCAGCHCSASKDAAKLLLAAGHTNVYAFEGGMEDWLKVGYPVSCNDAAACDEPCSS
ncbi:rhodanese-like domain-containing protein [Methylomonas koyamae]|uniref:rhodanese-like domain-containing protein n=1 Tax=Methylomonas koyamae TaxID=702114 RepID=UPI0011260569|nr:rhodanese-like domain-containing protein [Methylomonas koyamae]TPQ24746.1 rhodanese-like domain-containing protein [Methylomonas koyamae]